MKRQLIYLFLVEKAVSDPCAALLHSVTNLKLVAHYPRHDEEATEVQAIPVQLFRYHERLHHCHCVKFHLVCGFNGQVWPSFTSEHG